MRSSGLAASGACMAHHGLGIHHTRGIGEDGHVCQVTSTCRYAVRTWLYHAFCGCYDLRDEELGKCNRIAIDDINSDFGIVIASSHASLALTQGSDVIRRAETHSRTDGGLRTCRLAHGHKD